MFNVEEYIRSLPGAKQNPDGSWNVVGDVYLYNKGLTSLQIRFRKVTGHFDCSYNQLTTLAGAPQEVGGVFYCYHNQLTTLEGAPQEVGGDFYCSYNQLKNFKGKPKHIGGKFVYDNNPMDQLMQPGSENDDIDQIINGF